MAVTLASAPAAADPIVLNTNFTATDTAANPSTGTLGPYQVPGSVSLAIPVVGLIGIGIARRRSRAGSR